MENGPSLLGHPRERAARPRPKIPSYIQGQSGKQIAKEWEPSSVWLHSLVERVGWVEKASAGQWPGTYQYKGGGRTGPSVVKLSPTVQQSNLGSKPKKQTKLRQTTIQEPMRSSHQEAKSQGAIDPRAEPRPQPHWVRDQGAPSWQGLWRSRTRVDQEGFWNPQASQLPSCLWLTVGSYYMPFNSCKFKPSAIRRVRTQCTIASSIPSHLAGEHLGMVIEWEWRLCCPWGQSLCPGHHTYWASCHHGSYFVGIDSYFS